MPPVAAGSPVPLVPKLRLGTPSRSSGFECRPGKQELADRVPKQELGNEPKRAGAGYLTLLVPLRRWFLIRRWFPSSGLGTPSRSSGFECRHGKRELADRVPKQELGSHRL